jgi:hypothetical protein
MRTVSAGLACIVILIFLPGQALTQDAVTWAADVPLLDCDGTPCVEAHLGDSMVVRLGIDTGNAASIVDTKTAASLGLKPSAPPKPGAPAGMYRSIIPAVSFGSATLQNVSIVVMDLSDMITQNQMPHVAGTLAYTAFQDRALQLDFVGHRLRISEPLKSQVPCPDPCDKISLIKFGHHGPPIVVAEGFAVNHHPVSAQIDTMFTGSLLVYTSALEKTGLSAQAKTSQERMFAFTDGGVKMKQSPADSEMFHKLTFGEPTVYFPTPGVHEPDGLFDATVGLELFRDSVVTLDFHNMNVSVQRHS